MNHLNDTHSPRPLPECGDEAIKRAQQELKRAWLQLSWADLDGARAAAARAGELVPTHPLPGALAGAIEIAAGDPKKALSLLRKVTRRWPEAPSGHLYYAEACLLLGRFGQGKKALATAREIDLDEAWSAQIEHLEELFTNLDPRELPPPRVLDRELEDHAHEPG